MEGRKDDQGKLRTDLLPPDVLEAMAQILTDGADRYGDRNWEQGMKWSRPYGALLRHILSWWQGEDTDPDSGRPHLWHALCCVSFLVAYEQRKIGQDDRPPDSHQDKKKQREQILDTWLKTCCTRCGERLKLLAGGKVQCPQCSN